VSDLALSADAAATPIAPAGAPSAGHDRLARVPPAWTIAAALAAVYLILAPPSGDLAAAGYRSDLFARVGFTLWDNSWYGGHHLLAYSVLAPALGALIGQQPLAALSVTLASALFAALIKGRFPARATRIAGAWFALGAAIDLLSNRIPFDLGLPIALGALLAAQRRRLGLALVLAVLASLASPVAGAFLALAFLAWALAGPHDRRRPALLTLAALAPVVLLNLAFPEGGTQPFVASAFFPALAGVLVIGALIPPEQRLLRIGALLYALALTGSYVLSTSVGGNADRLGALMGAPVTALLLLGGSTIGRRPRLLLAAAPLLLYWQANAPAADFASAQRDDPATQASYYAPLLGELRALGVGYGSPPTRPARIEVVPLADHWEARWLAPHIMIARGWERQLDTLRNAVFYAEEPLTAQRYEAWLWAQAISYVALPGAPLDYSASAEARLLRGAARPDYLREVWRSAHWRLFAVRGARPLAQPPGLLTQLNSDSFTLYAPRAGAYTVRLHFTPYWALATGSGCVSEAPGDWTRLQARRAGSLRVVIDFSLDRVFDHGPRCNLG
jgi:hypothetical protein